MRDGKKEGSNVVDSLQRVERWCMLKITDIGKENLRWQS